MPLLKKAYITRTLKRNALRKGLLGGSPFWRAIWAGQLVLKGWGKVSKGGEAPISFDESLKEGDAWTLVHAPEKTRKHRRKFLSAPSAERINEILGPDRVNVPPPTRRERRATKKQQKASVKQAKSDSKAEAKDSVVRAKADAQAAKDAAKADAKNAAVRAKADAQAAKDAAKADAKNAAVRAKADAQAAKDAAKADAKAAKQAEKELRRASSSTES